METTEDMEPINVVEKIRIPEVKCITLKGPSAIDRLEKELNESSNKKMGLKYTAKRGGQMAGINFQTRSSTTNN